MTKALEDLEFHVGTIGNKCAIVNARTYKSAAEAYKAAQDWTKCGDALVIDVVTWSKEAAHAWAGDHGVEEYEADPDASVHDRIVQRKDGSWESTGRVA